MGGRGGSSGQTTNRGNFPSQDLKKMSMEQLRTLDDDFNRAIGVQEKIKIKELDKRKNPWDTPSQKYYDAQAKKQELQKGQRNVVSEIVKRKHDEAVKNKNQNKKTFVNSFGEATTREITTAVYKRWQKKLDKLFLR